MTEVGALIIISICVVGMILLGIAIAKVGPDDPIVMVPAIGIVGLFFIALASFDYAFQEISNDKYEIIDKEYFQYVLPEDIQDKKITTMEFNRIKNRSTSGYNARQKVLSGAK